MILGVAQLRSEKKSNLLCYSLEKYPTVCKLKICEMQFTAYIQHLFPVTM